MFQLPKSTEFNKRIPKQKFYDNLDIPSRVKQEFKDKIQVIYWRNKISADTINLATGEEVDEVEVFEIKLRHPDLSVNVLKQIDREIPYHILFLLEYKDKYQAWIGYKEATGGNAAFKVNQYYHTDWQNAPDLTLHIEGLDMDAVYEHFVRQVAGEALQINHGESLSESIQHAQRREQLQKQIIKLETAIKREKQLNIQIQKNAELKKLKKELEAL